VIKLAQGFLRNLKSLHILSSVETLQDNGDEQVQENERNNHHETDEERICFRFRAASSDPVSLDILVCLRLYTVKTNGPCSRTVIHDKIPRFSRGHPQKCNQRPLKRLKVGMNIESILKLHLRKQEYSQHRVKEQKQEQQTSNIGQLRYGTNESIEEDSQVLVLLNNLEDPTDSERTDHSGQGADVKAWKAVNDHTEPSGDDDHHIEIVPAVAEVVGSKTY
jgi:hypothetical protein